MFYWYLFEDGYSCAVKGMSKGELAKEIRKHGKLIAKKLAC